MEYEEHLRNLSALETAVRKDEDSGKLTVSTEKFLELISVVEAVVRDLKQKRRVLLRQTVL